MNRAIIITTGIIIVLIVLGLWVYLMLFGTPKSSDEVFTNLGFELTPQNTTITPPKETTPLENLVNTQSKQALRQLTTRAVAGFAFSNATTSSSTTIRYVEKGTGHMYEINLTTGVETILSRTTVPQVRTAIFSPDANTVALTSYDGYIPTVFVGTLGEKENLLGISLQPGAKNIAFASDNEVLYTISSDTPNKTNGYRHNIDTLTQTELFSLPYKNIDVSWGNNFDAIYITTKPARDLEGFSYTIKDNILTPITPALYGLSTLISSDNILLTYYNQGAYTSSALRTDDNNTRPLPLLTLKEKCTFDAFSSYFVWCGAPIESPSSTFVEDWYKGIIISDDSIWLVNTNSQTAQLYTNPQQIVGRSLDIQNMTINTQGTFLAFTNKKDSTLWLYDLASEQ